MQSEYRIENISASLLEGTVQHYPQIVKPQLHERDKLRYEELPQKVESRGKDRTGAFLIKDEVLELVEWKLHHGTYRPKLKQLVESNDAKAIEPTTREAFASFDGTPEKAKSCLTQLSTFKGIGPATASLLLSVAFPDEAPFFSDELFRWCFWEEGKGKGWDRLIKYTPKEYMELFVKLKELKARIDVRAVDVEKAAYVLGNSDASTLDASTNDGLNKTKRKIDNADGEELSNVETGAAVTKKAKSDARGPSKSVATVTQPKTTAKKSSVTKKPQNPATRSSARLRSSNK